MFVETIFRECLQCLFAACLQLNICKKFILMYKSLHEILQKLYLSQDFAIVYSKSHFLTNWVCPKSDSDVITACLQFVYLTLTLTIH